MKFKSTRGKAQSATFREALFKGLAPDGGLYHPETTPDLSGLYASFNKKTSFKELAAKVTSAVLGPEINEETASRISENAFSFRPELSPLTDRLSILELYHGPTCAFKDFGACFMAAAMEEFLLKEDKKTTILVATSGDTGSAVAQAFHGKKNIDVIILYPSGRVSTLQEKQLTTLGGNVSALEINGAFDDCQRMVKEAFLDSDLNNRLVLTSANSINLGRLFPQSFYYIYGFAQLERSANDRVYFCVPSGNFGNLTAGVYAWKWGLGVEAFIAATNTNDVVPEYLTTSEFRPRASIHTLSNAMDVGNPSNFERLMELYSGDWTKMKSEIFPQVVTDSDTIETIARIFSNKGRFIDPHTAVGVLASERFEQKLTTKSSRIIILATAHPAKFPETVERATGKAPELPDALKEALSRPKKSIRMENQLSDLKEYLLSRS